MTILADVIRITKNTRAEFSGAALKVKQIAFCYNTDLPAVGGELVIRAESGLSLGQSHTEAGADSTTYYFWSLEASTAQTWNDTLTSAPDAEYASVEVKLDSFNKGSGDRLLSVTNSDTGEVLGSIRGDGNILFLKATISEGIFGDLTAVEATVDGTLDVINKINAGQPTVTDATLNVLAPSVDGEVFYVIDSSDSGNWADGNYTEVDGLTILGQPYFENEAGTRWLRAIASFSGGPAFGWGIVTSIDPNFEWRTADGFYQATPDVGDYPEFNASTFTGEGTLSGFAADVDRQTGVVADKAMSVEGNIHLDGAIKSQDGNIVLDIIPTGDDRGFKVTGGEFSVGSVDDPRETILGCGDSYPVPLAYHCDTANTAGSVITGAVDVSTILQSDTGSTAGLFAGTTAGRYLLVGSDYPYYGVKVKLTDGGTVEADNIVVESWETGNVFQQVSLMASDAVYPYQQYANQIGDSLNQQWRFGFTLDGPETWTPVELTINGQAITKYWGRLRIDSAITADATVEQVKLHTSRTEINGDGFIEKFGFARNAVTLQAGLQNITPNTLVNPADESVLYGANATAGYLDNEFASTADDGFLLTQGINSGLDTSIPLILSISYYVKGTATGDLVFDVEVFQVGNGFVYDGTATPDTYSVTDTISASSDLVRRSSLVYIDAQKVTQGEAIVISIRRNASSNPADTLGGNIVVTYVSLTGYSWR